jgi:hypothetical protein
MCTGDPGLEEVLEFEKIIKIKNKSARIKTKGFKI